jgi:hypothetical protein
MITLPTASAQFRLDPKAARRSALPVALLSSLT